MKTSNRLAVARTLACMVTCLILLPGLLPAQVTPDLPEIRGRRMLAVGHVAFFDQLEPTVTVGLLGQLSLDTMAPTMEEGVATYAAPRWYLHGLATAGITTFEVWDFAAYGEVGVVRRMDMPGLITSVGLAGFGSWRPRGLGGVVRSDVLMDNAYVQGGVIYFTEAEAAGFYVGFGLMRCLLKDLEFADRCIGG